MIQYQVLSPSPIVRTHGNQVLPAFRNSKEISRVVLSSKLFNDRVTGKRKFSKKKMHREKKQSKAKQNKIKQNKTKHRTRCFDIFVEHSSLVTKFCITIYIEFHNAQQFQQYFTECPLILQFDVDEHARNTLYTP